MRIGIFADTHDHLDHIRLAVEQFNRLECELVVFAGDFVSTFAIPPLRKLNCPMIAAFGDSEGNRDGIRAGMRIIGEVGVPPFGFRTADGTKILLTHHYDLVKNVVDGADVVIYSHTHRPSIQRDSHGILYINPGETCGWTYRKPSIALLETSTMEADIVDLPAMASPPVLH